MADTTTFQVYIYDCPPKQRKKARRLVEALDVDWGSGRHAAALSLDEPYTDHHASGCYSEELADALIEVAPGASFVAWTDPAHDWQGSLVAYAPALGRFAAECDSQGTVLFSASQVRAVMDSKEGQEDLRAAIGKAMGDPWLKDWRAH